MKHIVKNKYGEIRPLFSIVAVFVGTFGIPALLRFVISVALGAPVLPARGTAVGINTALTVLMYAVQTVCIALCFRWLYRRHWRELGLGAKKAGAWLAFGLAFGAISIAVVAGLLLVSGQAVITDADPARVWMPAFWH
jgi:uncharacterized membrane protein YkvI